MTRAATEGHVSGTITAIREAEDGTARLVVFVDGHEAFSVSPETAERLGLAVGETVADEPVAAADVRSARGAAREAALRLLAVRARSRHELSDRLTRKGHDGEVVAEVIGALEGVGLVDDEDFTRLWVEERTRLRPVGARKLRQELSLKGIDAATVGRVLDELFSETPEIELARRALAKRKRVAGGGDPVKRRARDHAFLVRRGFSYEVAARALKEEESPDG